MNPARLSLPLSIPFAALVLAFAALSPHAAQAGTETRSVGEFDAITLGGSFKLNVSQGPQASVQVQADDKVLPLIETVVEKGRLLVRWKRGTQTGAWNSGDVNITVVTPKLSGLATSGAGDIQLQPFNTPALKLSISGSGNAMLQQLSTEELGVSVAGSGDVKGNGKAAKVAISIAGSGDVKLIDMKSDEATVKISGSGSATVNAGKTLAVSIAGSGDVTYSGEATVKSSVAGSGNVTKR